VAVEIEYKFSLLEPQVPPEEELAPSFSARRLVLQAPESRTQHDVYFDTHRRHLRQAGVTFRERTFQGRRFATLKAAGTVKGGLHRREELELPMTGDTWPEAICRELAAYTALVRLKPVLELRTERMVYRVRHHEQPSHQQPFAEVAFDAVSARYPGKDNSAHFNEVEIEALAGASAETLDEVVAALSDVLTLVPSGVNKLERAEALLSLAQTWEE
jgi:triphosphatase